MYETKESLIELVEKFPPDKIQALYSYANFLNKMPDESIVLENDDIQELQKIISNDKYYSGKELLNKLSAEND